MYVGEFTTLHPSHTLIDAPGSSQQPMDVPGSSQPSTQINVLEAPGPSQEPTQIKADDDYETGSCRRMRSKRTRGQWSLLRG